MNRKDGKEYKNMSDMDWEILIKSLKNNRCIICIGPGIYASSKEKRFEDEYIAFMKEQSGHLGIKVYDDGWIHLPTNNRIDACYYVKKFYEQPLPIAEQRLKLLSQIPFHFLISFIPDYKIKEQFENQDFDFSFASYQKKKTANQSVDSPTHRKPLLFNMIGELEEHDSLIITYDDFYAYLSSVFQGNSMADKYKEKVFEADHFIFLGIPFDKWYTHLFMRILQQHDPEVKSKSKQFAANLFLNDAVTSRCHDQYTLTFVPSDINDFLTELHKRCDNQEKSFIRSANTHSIAKIDFNQVEQWLREDEVDKVFEMLESKVILNEDYKDALSLMRKRKMEIELNSIKGILTTDQRMASSSQLSDDIQRFIRLLKPVYS